MATIQVENLFKLFGPRKKMEAAIELVGEGLAQKDILKAFHLDDQQIGSLMDAMKRHESEAEAARQWMGGHGNLVDSWLNPAYK